MFFIDGGSTDKSEIGKYTIEPFLKCRGVSKIDYLLISHGDADHYNGVLEILEDENSLIEIKNIVFTKRFFEDEGLLKVYRQGKKRGINLFTIKPGDKLSDKEMKITCIAPENPVNWEANEKSMVLSLKYKKFSMLLTGDTEKRGEDELYRKLKGMEDKRYLVLKVAHHGSKYTTRSEILDMIKPKFAIISAGINSAHGHPHKETISKLKKRDINIYDTPSNGCIIIQINGKNMNIKTYW